MTEERKSPHVSNAPGLIWKPRKNGWAAYWQARTDLVKRGFDKPTVPLWTGATPNETECAFISDRCNELQAEMLVWGRGGIKEGGVYDGTLATLALCYQTDADSNFKKLQYRTRDFYVCLIRRIETDRGTEKLADINARLLKRWHEEWTARGIAASHSYMGMLRTLFGFGFTFLECDDCERLCAIMHKMRFKQAAARSERMTADQATAIRERGRYMGWYSVALAQAFQFDCTFRQKDVIGEWVPVSEPGLSDTTWHGEKWLKGIRYEEIDANLILRHTTSKRGKDIEIDLKLAPMVLEELIRDYPDLIVVDEVSKKVTVNRGLLPASGPILICEITGLPWKTPAFRRTWRKVADEAGVPSTVKNMDSRAGAISEATDAGIALEDIRHAATHSDISMTQRYSRGASEKVAKVMQLRVAHRNKQRTDE